MKEERKFLNCVLAVVMAMAMMVATPIMASAEEIIDSGECGTNGSDVTWTLDSEGILTVSGTGEMKGYRFFYYFGSNSPWSESSCIEEIAVNNGVTSIGMGAFPYCTALTSVTLPDSLTSIGQFAFYGCSNLKDVFYSGTKEEWENIKIGGNNEPLKSATIHYNGAAPDNEPIVPSVPSGKAGKLDGVLHKAPNVYDKEIATIAAELSLKIYDGKENIEGWLQNEHCFAPDMIHSGNFDSGNLAYTVATKEYKGSDSDGNTGLIVIVAQGSTTPYELIKDATGLPSNGYNGYPVYDIVGDFVKEILIGLNQLPETGKKYKVLVTGHSLGGASANLLAAMLTDRSKTSEAKNKYEVFCYTFGAINSIKSDTLVKSGYENIHNVYNYLDTFSPYQCGKELPTGMGRGYGKFGTLEPFVLEKRSAFQIVSPKALQILQHVNHDMSNYYEAVKSSLIENSPFRSKAPGELDLYSKHSVYACPVDLDVYCDGELIGRTTNNEVVKSSKDLKIIVEDDVKFVVFPDDKSYDITITAYDEGTMTFGTYGMKDGKVKLITDVALVSEKTMTSEITEEDDIPDIQLKVLDENGIPIKEVLDGGEEIDLSRSQVNPFVDVYENDLYFDAVLWAYYATPQVTNGINADHFGPKNTVKRGEAVTFLWRAMGCPEPASYNNPFKDVKSSDYFYKPVLWAIEKGITKGTTETTFAPNDTLSTAHMITFLYRTVIPGKDGWYEEAADWACQGFGGNPFGVSVEVNNKTQCPRGYVAEFLYKYHQMEEFSEGHRYDFIISDESWEKARKTAKSAGGHLVTINDRTEYNVILSQIREKGHQDIQFRIGARRDPESKEYHWIDSGNNLIGEVINSPGYWSYPEFEDGEPSFRWDENEEAYLMIYYNNKAGKWVLNDVADEVYAPGENKYGYIIEYDE